MLYLTTSIEYMDSDSDSCHFFYLTYIYNNCTPALFNFLDSRLIPVLLLLFS